MLSVILEAIKSLVGRKPVEDKWVSVYRATLVLTDAVEKKPVKQWCLTMEVNGDKLRIDGVEMDVDLLEHPCYNNIFKPWSEQRDWVVLKDGTFYNFDLEEHVSSLANPQVVVLDEMSIEEMEKLAENLIENRQPKTATGQFAIDYGMQIKAQLESSEKFVSEYFSRKPNV